MDDHVCECGRLKGCVEGVENYVVGRTGMQDCRITRTPNGDGSCTLTPSTPAGEGIAFTCDAGKGDDRKTNELVLHQLHMVQEG